MDKPIMTYSNSVEVDTEGVQRLLGRTIIAVHRDPPSEEAWAQDDETLTLTLDDGSVWEFAGWGYDASGLKIRVLKEDDGKESQSN